MKEKYIHLGCDHTAPKSWKNYDGSILVGVQKIPLFGSLILKKLGVKKFPSNITKADITKPISSISRDSCNAVFISHVLEHMSREEAEQTVAHIYSYLKKGGILRIIVPDLEQQSKTYLQNLRKNPDKAHRIFMHEICMGHDKKPGLKRILEETIGYTKHKFLWDEPSLKALLRKKGFKKVRLAKFNDSKEKKFKQVENKGRFEDSICLEAVK